MKTKLNILIIAFIVLLFSNKLFAQSNLQFNKVIYKNFVGNGSGGSYTIVDTLTIIVDTNKVVKIESAAANITSNSIGNDVTSNAAAITLDNVVISAASYSTTVMPRNVFPIWLPQGTYKIAMIAMSSPASGYISAIEYNLIH